MRLLFLSCVTLLVAVCFVQADGAIFGSTFDTKATATQFCLTRPTGGPTGRGAAFTVAVCPGSGEDLLGFVADNRRTVAMCYHSFSTRDIGWDMLEVLPYLASSGGSPSRNQLMDAYYQAGFLEGYVTYKNLTQIKMPGLSSTQWENVSLFISENIDYMNRTSQAQASADKFWARVGMMLQQVAGIADGFNLAAAGVNDPTRASFTDAYLAAMYFELNFDIIPKFRWNPNGTKTTTTTKASSSSSSSDPSSVGDPGNGVPPPLPFRPTHCSAIVKVSEDNLWMSHASWFDFSFNRRIFKTYHFDTTVRMSSYVGFLYSGDDWYMTSNKIAAFETSLSNYRWEVLKDQIVSNGVATFIRVMAANYLASDAKTWAVTYFSRENMGTYNNQYGAVDMKLFTPGQGSPSKALPESNVMWIAEQLPGMVETMDVTSVLRETGYFASYNIAYIKKVYDAAGYDINEKRYGSFFSYNETTRALIFRRNQSMVKETKDMQELIRWNGYLINDPLCRIPNCEGTLPVDGVCNPASTPRLAIANRGDRAPPRAGNNATTMGPLWDWWTRGANGAYDGKVVSFRDFDSMDAYIISGPTQSNGLPPFTFTENADLFPAGTVLPPDGMPDTFNFPWVKAKTATSSASGSTTPFWSDKQSVGAVVGGVLGFIGLILVVAWVRRQKTSLSGRLPLLGGQQQEGVTTSSKNGDDAHDSYRAVQDQTGDSAEA